MGRGGDPACYSLADVAAHTSEEDCWLVIRGQVYDVTRFLNKHPGGKTLILSVSGTDATEPYEDVVHSGAADVLLKKYHVGEYQPSAEELAAAAAAGAMAVSRKTFGQKIVLSLLPLVLLLIAVALA